MITIPIGSYATGQAQYSAISSQGIFGYERTDVQTRRCLAVNDTVYFAWISMTDENVAEYLAMFNETMPFGNRFILMGMALSDSPFFISQASFNGKTYNYEYGDGKTAYYNGLLYAISPIYSRVSNSDYPTLTVLKNGIYNDNEYSSISAAISASGIRPISSSFPITYYPTNVTLDPAPPEAAVGDTVTVGVSVPAGYTIRDPSSNIVVRNNGVIVPHTWDASTSRFTFTMPDPSQ